MSGAKPRVLVLHGPNLNLLGRREPHIYGAETLEDINRRISGKAAKLGFDVEIIQTNHEGVMVDYIQTAMAGYAGVVVNPAALTHYSIAVRDALAALSVPVIEIHISNIYCREDFRRHSVTAPVVTGQISGLGPSGYLLALEALAGLLNGGESQ